MKIELAGRQVKILNAAVRAKNICFDQHFRIWKRILIEGDGRIGVNAALALVVFLVWNGHGIVQNGVGGWLAHFTGGAPWYIWIIMIPVEIIGAIVKPVALTIRLFANMTAGHVLLAAILWGVALRFLLELRRSRQA